MNGQPQLLYTRVLKVTYRYLGPAADRFVTRQITGHLNKNPERLGEEDLTELIAWMEIAMAFLTNDHRLIKSYINSLEALTKPKGHLK